jgi:thiamine kinase-like enzyme
VKVIEGCALNVDESVRSLIAGLAAVRGQAFSVSELHGGLTNRNFKVDVGSAAYVVRISSDQATVLAIDRDCEYRNSVLAAASGVGARVIEYDPGLGVLVVEYLDGVTLTDADFATPGMIGRVAQACRRLHAGQKFENDFDMFVIQRKYLEIVERNGYRIPADYMTFTEHVDQVAKALAVRAGDTVPCNNDLLAGNFIDDGNQLRLIDYEYSGNNDPCFELGNIWSECHLTDDQLDELVESYYGRTSRQTLARARLYGLMSRYGWTLWACIQAASSQLDFDFWSWGMEKYDAAVETFRGPDLRQFLTDAQCSD